MIPLHAACLNGNGNILKELLKAGNQGYNIADLAKKDIKNMIPIHFAIIKDHAEILRYLHQQVLTGRKNSESENKGLLDKKYHCNETGSKEKS